MCVLLLSVMIDCKNKTEEEKPKESEPTLVQNNSTSYDNSTLNGTSQGNLGKARHLRNEKDDKSKRTEAPSTRLERPKRTEGPKLRSEEQAPSSRVETELPKLRVEEEGPRIPTSLKVKDRSEVPSSRVETEGPKLRSEKRPSGNLIKKKKGREEAPSSRVETEGPKLRVEEEAQKQRRPPTSSKHLYPSL